MLIASEIAGVLALAGVAMLYLALAAYTTRRTASIRRQLFKLGDEILCDDRASQEERRFVIFALRNSMSPKIAASLAWAALGLPFLIALDRLGVRQFKIARRPSALGDKRIKLVKLYVKSVFGVAPALGAIFFGATQLALFFDRVFSKISYAEAEADVEAVAMSRFKSTLDFV